ncbi:hypothetical protein ACFOPX_01230 [Helicobacter baculiformis]|uniref:Tumor necrosis factor alpha-inducing protein n=1 Tax=Helicobacter baculiformis TaxID=427351 RepID=A0ABV7ZF34_9HELI|nr:hypothetical protein [Helicobacter baculiformis]
MALKTTTLALVLVFALGACAPKHKKQVFLQNMPMWMVQDRSMYVTQGIDSSHVIDNQVERSEKIARERARFRVAIHIADKIKGIYTAAQNAEQKAYDSEIFKEITQAIAASLDREVQLGEYINPNNKEVFMLVRVSSYNATRLQQLLDDIEVLDTSTIQQIMHGVKKVFEEAIDYDDVQVPKSM